MGRVSNETLEVAPTKDPRQVRTADNRLLSPPAGWALLPPGDAGLTRRVKAAGPSWTVIEMKGRKRFSQGVWAPEAHIVQARAALETERSTETYAKRRVADAARRDRDQQAYVIEFANAVLAHLRFAPTLPHAGAAPGGAHRGARDAGGQRHRRPGPSASPWSAAPRPRSSPGCGTRPRPTTT